MLQSTTRHFSPIFAKSSLSPSMHDEMRDSSSGNKKLTETWKRWNSSTSVNSAA